MVTVYDVSRSQGQLLHINAPPYCFIPGNHASSSHLGEAFLKHPLDTRGDALSLVRLTEQGSLHQIDLRTSETHSAPTFDTLWTADVKQLDRTAINRREAPFSNQAFVETDFSQVYEHIFQLPEQEREKIEEENASAVYDLLETLPSFWQEAEPPLEHILTTYDVVFRGGDDPDQCSRADFFTESVINSTRGYRAVLRGRLAPNSLSIGASWHQNIIPILQRFDPDITDDLQSGTTVLGQYDLVEDPERSVESLRYEKDAREQLALDLALSADTFSSQPFSNIDGELEAMAKTLSLAGEPPSMEFGYLRPRNKDHYNKDKESEEFAVSMGVRSLLKDWEIGADPEEYQFVDHYDGSAPIMQPIRRTKPNQGIANTNQQPGTQLQRPPMILATSAIVPPRPPEIGRRMLTVQSQETNVPPRTIGFGSQVALGKEPQSSQDCLMVNTQVLPGVHGGRPGTAKKKIPKKRIGGF
ncbi:hypothetical protein H0H81_010109 [Sphagnurus paluster]|uniref:RRN6 K-rich C-terminal domain-containing protein n=1 Tax=Sphagnurus paluster TaxID=117069 RepID=A0A9P7KNU2_9AGAR|nr:hypothetical protein H0H81_010109 [Sphagnurus paluster]